MQYLFYTLIVAILGTLGTWIIKELVPYIKANTDASTLNKIKSWTAIAVQAAETIFKGTGKGKDKFDYVSKFITSKFNLNEKEIEIIIEDAVKSMKNMLSVDNK